MHGHRTENMRTDNQMSYEARHSSDDYLKLGSIPSGYK